MVSSSKQTIKKLLDQKLIKSVSRELQSQLQKCYPCKLL